MSLNVAVQMDPIENINVKGDSTFAMMLEARRAEHAVRQIKLWLVEILSTGQRLVKANYFFTGEKSGALSTNVVSCARTRPSTWAISPPPTCWTTFIPGRWW
jgi:hypothetical protein